MRDVLLSGTAGFLASCAAAFAVHRSLWKAAHDHAQRLDDLAGKPLPTGAEVPKHKLVSRHVSSSIPSSRQICIFMCTLRLSLALTPPPFVLWC